MNEAPTSQPLGLPARILKIVFSPGEVFESLRERPVWVGAFLVSAGLVVLSVALIPAEVWVELMRENARSQGTELPGFFESVGPLFTLFSALAGGVFLFLTTLVLAGIVTFVFAFLFGDEGTYKQYLSVVSHGLLISSLGGFLLLPLRILQRDPELTLNVGTFIFFFTEGYLFRVLKMMDLFGLWGFVVMGIGVSAMDSKRGSTSGVLFFVGLAVAFALVFGIFGG